MATRFSVPASPKKSILEIDEFLGVDLTNTGSNISETRSPNAPNMIRDVPGKVRKRMGYRVEKDFCEYDITDDVSYKALKTFYNYALPRELSNTRVVVDYFTSAAVPTGQKYALLIRYSTTGNNVAAILAGGKTYCSLPNTNGNVRDIILTSDDFNNDHLGGFIIRCYDESVTIYGYKGVIVSNNIDFRKFDLSIETLELTSDDLFTHSGLKSMLAPTVTHPLNVITYSKINKQAIGNPGLKRVEVRATIDDSAAPFTTVWSSAVRFTKDDGTKESNLYMPTYGTMEQYRVGRSIVFYIQSSLLEEYDNIGLQYWTVGDSNITRTMEFYIQDADYINYATIKPVEINPVYGGRVIKSTQLVDGSTLYNKNRFVYDFDTKGDIVLNIKAKTGYTLGGLGNNIPRGAPAVVYMRYSSTQPVEICFIREDMTRSYTKLDTGNNLVYKKINFMDGVSAVYFLAGNADATLKIHQLFIAQQGTEEVIPIDQIKYSPAPEIRGEIFVNSAMYNSSSTKHTILNEKTISANRIYSNAIDTLTDKFSYKLSKNKLQRIKGRIRIDSITGGTKPKAIEISLWSFNNTGWGSSLIIKIIEGAFSVGQYIDIDLFVNPDWIDTHTGEIALLISLQFESVNTSTASASIRLDEFTLQDAAVKSKFLTQDERALIHVGNDLYLQDGIDYKKIYSKMNKARSSYWQLENNVYIADGNTFLVYDNANDTISEVYGGANTYVPTLTIAKATKSGKSSSATSYEAINLLNPRFKESFTSQGDADSNTVCQMSRAPLDTNSEVRAWVMDSNGNMVEKTKGTHFSVNYSTGTITFTYKIGEPPLTGEDNIIIQAMRTPDGYKDRINKCRFGALFGVNGESDRLFLSGNPTYINYDWYSGYYDFTYFPDNGYSKLGLDTSAIVGYSIINNYLATHKDKNEPTQGVIIREGDLIDGEPAFKIINTLQGEGAIAPFSFAYLETEPLFLTRSGIFAITASDVTGDKYSQNRSFYLNGQLTEEIGMKDAFAIIHNDMYWLFLNNKVYVLDGLQAVQGNRNEPYSTRQYVGFLLTNLPVYVAWENNDELWFGTTDGKVCKFYSNKEALESYNDNGEPIEAWWETPDLDGDLFYKNKTFRYMAIRLKSNIKTGAKLYSQVRGIWTLFKDCRNISNIIFRFSEIVFSKFTFNHDTSDKVVSSKLRVKKIDKARFKIENSELNEPFGIQNLAFGYVQGGDFKG